MDLTRNIYKRIIIIVLILLTITSGFLFAEEDDSAILTVGTVETPDTSVNIGNAAYSINIDVPPGRAGVQPDISLNYNSFGKNSSAGIGWELSEHYIQRSTKYGLDYLGDGFVVDGVTDLIKIDSNGNYRESIEYQYKKYRFLGSDGWVVTATDGTKYYYGSRGDANSRQTKSTYVYRWYLDRVIDSNGNQMYYNYIKDQNRVYLKWINYTGNANTGEEGTNTVNFYYYENRYDPLPSYKSQVEAVTGYLLRTIEVQSYDGLVRAYSLGYGISSRILRSRLNNLKQYGALASVDQETGQVLSGTPLKETSFQYTDTSETGKFNTAIPWRINLSATNWSKNSQVGDFDGDGKMDLVYPWIGGPTNKTRGIFLYSNGNGTFEEKTLIFDEVDLPVVDLTTSGPFILDVNGDNLDDIVFVRQWSTGADEAYYIVYRANRNRTFTYIATNRFESPEAYQDGAGSVTICGFVYPNICDGEPNNQIFTEDINNDGNDDLLVLGSELNSCFNGSSDYDEFRVIVFFGKSDCTFSDGAYAMLYEKETWKDLWGGLLLGQFAQKVNIADMNDDGKKDILIIDFYQSPGFKTRTFFATKSPFGSFTFQGEITDQPATEDEFIDKRYQKFMSDFNGDGLADILIMFVHDGPLNTSSVYFSKGDGTYSPAVFRWIEGGSWYNSNYKTFLKDINGDGLTDFVVTYANDDDSSWGLTTSVYLSRGNGTFTDANRDQRVKNICSCNHDDYNIRFADFTGDGKDDLALLHYHYDDTFIDSELYIAKGTPGFSLLNTITQNTGFSADITYKPSTVGQTDYSMPFVVTTVKSITTHDGIGNNYKTDYSYTGGLYDAETREFRGFHDVSKKIYRGSAIDKIIQTRYYQDYFKKGNLDFVQESTPDEILRKTKYTWYDEPLEPFVWGPEPRHRIQLEQKHVDVYKNNSVVAFNQEDYTYYDETHGNLKEIINTGTNLDETITTTYDYTNCDNDWRWRKSLEEVEGSNTGLTRRTEYTDFDINGNYRYKKQKRMFNGLDEGYSITEYTYDDQGYGNVVEVYYPEVDTPEITTYDTQTHTFPETITNPLGHVVRYEYDYKFGKVKHIEGINHTDLYPEITEYDYDEFGRIQQVDYPDTGQTIYTYMDDGTDSTSPRYVHATTKENDSGDNIEKRDFYDGFGRSIQTITKGETSTVVTRTIYDHLGRIGETKGPYFGSGYEYNQPPPAAHMREVTEYDILDRPLKTTSYINPEITNTGSDTIETAFTYNGFETTITDPDNKRKTEITDSMGRVVRVIEYPDDEKTYHTYYSYNAAGDLLDVQKHDENDVMVYQNAMAYDTLGLKREMIDPDMGTWTYTYYADGSLKTQTDNNLQEIIFQYDDLRRIESKSYNPPHPYSPPVYYDYDNPEAGKYGIGRLWSVSKVDSDPATIDVVTTYDAYDQMGRNTAITRTIGPSIYNTSYEYDYAGKTTRIMYPDETSAYYTYIPGSGLIDEVKPDPDISNYYTKFNEYTPTGKIGKITCSNSIVQTFSYDAKSDRLFDFITQDFNQLPTESIQWKEYTYTLAGNISKINDFTKDIAYNYEYDNLHRLTKEYLTGAGAPDVVTEAQVLAYEEYDPQHLHAVKTISHSYNGQSQEKGYTYNDNGNMVTGPDFTDPSAVADRNVAWYDAENMPVEINHSENGTTFIGYDGEGVRAVKVVGPKETHYVGEHYEVIDGNPTKYIFAGNLRVAMIKTDGGEEKIYYYHKDHLKSTNIVSQVDPAAGATFDGEPTEFMPYGLERNNNGQNVTDYTFTDQERDKSTGLYNYDARLYDPAIGLFVTPDSLIPNLYDPQSFNTYAYCRNNPLVYVDPSGNYYSEDDEGNVTEHEGPPESHNEYRDLGYARVDNFLNAVWGTPKGYISKAALDFVNFSYSDEGWTYVAKYPGNFFHAKLDHLGRLAGFKWDPQPDYAKNAALAEIGNTVLGAFGAAPKKRGPKGGIKHKPGRGHDSKSAPQQKKRFQKKAAEKKAKKQADYDNAKQKWDSLTPEQKKLLPELNPDD